MGRRILFACAECEIALVWPVDATPARHPETLTEETFAECRDQHGHEIVLLHHSARWKAKLGPSGIVTCPTGHTVGVRHLNGDASNAQLSLLRDRVITREMRGRV